MKHFYLLIFAIFIGPQVNSQTLVTKRFTPSSPVTVDGCGTYCTIPGLDPVTFTEADFPGISPQVTRVTVAITWLKTAGTCADPTNGDAFHNESNFRIDSPSTQVVLASPGTWSGNASISDVVTTIFTQSVSNVPSGTPTLGQYLPNGGNLNDFNDKSALGDWSLRPGDTVGREPMCISSYTVKVTAINDNIDPAITVCAPTPVDACLGDTVPDLTGSVTATDNVTTAPVITQSPVAGTPLSIGTTTITLTATDAAGNTGTCTVDQTLNDITAPTVTVTTTATECDVNNGALNFSFFDVPAGDTVHFSINNGVSYDYSFNASVIFGSANNLAAGDYDVRVRYSNADCSLSLGRFTIDALVPSSAFIIGSTDETICGIDDGSISFNLIDNPAYGMVEISLNGGTSYDYIFNDNAGNATINDLPPGDYTIWSRWVGDSCGKSIGTVTIAGAPGIVTTLSKIDASTGQDDGRIFVSFTDDPNQTQIKISIDDGVTYPYTFDDTTGNAELSGLGANTYNVWASYGNDTCFTSQGSVTIAEIAYTSVPDTNFETALDDLMYDNYLGDNKVPTSLINSVTSLNVASENITDLTGIESFDALQTLNISNNSLSDIDVSTLSNLTDLDISGNSMETAVISGNTDLRSFVARNAGLTSMDFSSNTLLREIDINGNSLTSLDFTLNTGLETLDVASNQLTHLDVKIASYEDITSFDARSNPGLTCIKVENSTYSTANWTNIDIQTSYSEYCEYTAIPDANFEAELELQGYDNISNDGQVPTELISTLTTLNIPSKNISDLTGIEDFVALTTLTTTGNPLNTIDLSENIALESISLQQTKLTNVDLSANTKLRSITITDDQLTTIDLTANVVLETLHVNSALEELDVSKNVTLTILTLDAVPITSLNLIANTGLTSLTINDSDQLTSLDLSTNTALEYLKIENNLLLTSIDLSTNVNLEYVYTNNSSLTSLDLNANPLVKEIEATNSRLIYVGVKNGENSSTLELLKVTGNVDLGCVEVDDAAAANSGTGNYGNWTKDVTTPYSEACLTNVPDDNFEQALKSLNYDDVLDNTVLTRVIKDITTLDVSNKDIVDPTGIEDFVGLVSLNMKRNSIISIDLSNLLDLQDLNLQRNVEMTTLNLDNLLKLRSLISDFNNISELTLVSPALISLQVFGNELTTLDVTKFTELQNLYCANNQITELDITQNTKLEILSCSRNSIESLDLSGSLLLTEVIANDNGLLVLNLKNGNNNSITTLSIQDNSGLTCVSVDDPVAANAGTGVYASWVKDASASYNEDCTQPVITLIGENPQTIELGDGYTELGAAVDDGSMLVINDIAFMDVVGDYTITYNATNVIGNPAVEVTRIVSVIDTTNPIAICQNINISLNLSGTATITGTQVDDGSNDLSGIASLAVSPSSFTTSDVGANTVTLTVTDTNGNSETCTSTVTVVDTIAPTMACQDITVQLDATGNVSITASQVDGGTFDASGIASLHIDITDFDHTNIGENMVTLTAIDNNGNTDTCIAIVTVEDNVPPVITLTGDNPQVIELGDGYTELGAMTDDGSNVVIDATNFVDAVGNYTIYYDATDASGNMAVQVTRMVNIVDTTAPVIILVGDNPQTIELGSGYTELRATTDDGSNVMINATDFVDAVGSYTIYYDATDASGNMADQVTRVVNVVDTTAPVITLGGDNPQTIELGTGYTELGATTDDGSDAIIDMSDFVDALGSYTITYNATDASGNSAIEVTRTVNVVDTMAPVITLIGDNPQIIELGSGYTELGATTDDDSNVMIDATDFVDAVGNYTITYNATDTSGNMAVQATRSVTVVDTTNPTVICQNIIAQLDDTGNVMITAAQIDNGSTDISGIVSFNLDITAFDCANIGDNTVSLTVTDANGNSNFCTATVMIEDSIDPVFDVATLPGDIQVPFDTGNMYTLADFTVGVTATDNCDTNRSVLTTTITQNPLPGTLLGAGDHTITLSIEDGNSNVTTATFTITVNGVLSIAENTKDRFTLYPNPSKDLFRISGLSNEARLIIRDINGRNLKEIEIIKDQPVSILDLPKGVYFITINQDNSFETLRLVKKE
ncbi:immunoglobulin-like domain-containing protein [uncultured Aquimarina sp.]|uniref:immunoglobulin-like domain-containing protein n=1 Tax=uncultured Aquimarina sp. TaxID=575652 RepID=UPI002633FE81|nr:immunoglobulin-like domain-containing protein [uncultured Aquimarina sp.]